MATKVKEVVELPATVVDTVRRLCLAKFICHADSFSLPAGGYGQRAQGKCYQTHST
jgi:hypothetical protein